MNETSKRIKAYKEALPGLRERVLGVALLLIMSLVMMTSATFAWLTLSRAPEVSSAATTVTANGNLEIALSNTEGTVPEASKAGDSVVTEGQSVVAANLTWGNMVNLSDPSYGLEKLLLRPAMLGSTSNLLNNPLITVRYGEDGRMLDGYNYNLSFTNWSEEDQEFRYYSQTHYGVRAISTTAYMVTPAIDKEYGKLFTAVQEAQAKAQTQYSAIVDSEANIDALVALMAGYMEAKLNGTLSSFYVTDYMDELYNMMADLRTAYGHMGDALAALINIEYFNYYGLENDYDHYTIEEADLWAGGAVNSALFNENIKQPSSLKQYIADVKELDSCIATMLQYYDPETQTAQATLWGSIEETINNLVKISTCTIALSEGDEGTQVGKLGVSNALQYLGKTVYAVIHDGLIVNFEALSGEWMCVKDRKISLKYQGIPGSVTAKTITTAANGTCTFTEDMSDYGQLGGGATERMAQDTYGMAIDVWVRTNAPNSNLILEGNVLTNEKEVPATKFLADGKEVDIYVATVTYDAEDEEGNPTTVEEEFDVYKLGDVWYYADTNSPVYKTETDTDGNTSVVSSRGNSVTIDETKQKMNTEYEVVGYEGENRVWDEWKENDLLSVNSTTQGSGSCYVFYADSPAEQENSLKLLSSLRIGFLDAEGNLLGKAMLDTEFAYENSGKVTVPLKLMVDNTVTNPTYYGENLEQLAITNLTQNEATWLTMIVYLEGTDLTNEQVLATSEIEGKLNVQFGTTESLDTIGDNDLETQEIVVTAELDDPANESEFDYGNGVAQTTVNVRVEGSTPKTVTGFFVRQINDTQGSREEEMTFLDPDGDGTWTATHTFDSPGTYVLNSVTVDGKDYDLDQEDPVKVVVRGFAITSVSCEGITAPKTSASVLTADNRHEATVSVTFANSDASKMPTSVQLQFFNDDTKETVTAQLTRNGATWSGSAVFTKSGDYTMNYVIMNGDYTELDTKYSLHLTLGVTAEITDNQEERTYLFEGDSIETEMTVRLYDGSGNPLPNLQDVNLNYRKAGSATSTLYSRLTWDADNQRYKGEFQLEEPGSFSFDHIEIGDSNITRTRNTAPVYTVIPPDPPVYVGNATDAYYLLADSDETASFEVLLKDADAARIWAVMKNASTDETVTVEGAKKNSTDGYNHFTFLIPSKNADGQARNAGPDGVWTITELQLADVYVPNPDDPSQPGTSYTEEKRLSWKMSEEGITTWVQTVTLTVSGDNEQLGGDDTYFMTTVSSTSDITIEVTDKLGNALNVTVKDVKASYQWEAKSDLDKNLTDTSSYNSIKEGENTFYYGAGYSGNASGTGNSNTAAFMIDNLPLTSSDGGKTFTRAGIGELTYAGLYTCYQIDLTIDGVPYRYGGSSTNFIGVFCDAMDQPAAGYLDAMPFFAFKTASPTVAITGVTPTTGSTYSVDETTSGQIGDEDVLESRSSNPKYRYVRNTHDAHTAGYSSSYTSTLATVYFQCSHTDTSPYTWTGWKYTKLLAWGAMLNNPWDYHQYTHPSVTITLTGIGNASGAELSFGDDALIYTSAAAAASAKTTYSWTANGPITRYIGTLIDNDDDDDDKQVADTITASTLVFTYDGKTYTFTIPTITINNPY